MRKALIWTQDNCRFCTLAKIFLHNLGYEIEERNINSKDWNKSDLLKALPNAKTVPQIYVGEQHIGGYTDLIEYSSSEHK